LEYEKRERDVLKNDLLASKLYTPQLRARLVPRPRVVELLEQGIRRALTLISAPAGSGKTTTLSSWLRDAEVMAAWLSLDGHDNDLQRFWTYVLASLDTLRPGALKNAQELLKAARSRQAPPIEDILTALINDLICLKEGVVLVLDDYHEIVTPAIHSSLTFLLDHLPEQVHLFIVSRSDPPFSLARLRTSDQLVEIRDLSFSPEETARFLNSVMRLQLTTEEIATLQARTEGWVAGLQLAALSIQRQSDVAGFIASFAGSHHSIVNYLSEEVLQKQPEQIQQFLLCTSLLDRLNASLCQEVTGDVDSRALLAQLEQANLFIIALDDEHNWYRHHQLFADFLRTRLQQSRPDLVSTLHHRAARWYQGNGYYEEAMNHLLLVQDFMQAAQLIEQSGEELMRRGAFTILNRWISRLPGAVVRDNLTIVIMHAKVLAFLAQLQAAELRLQEIETRLRDDDAWTEKALDRETIEGEMMAVRALLETQRLNFPQTIEFARRALEYLPAHNTFMRSVIALCLGIAFRFKDGPAARRALEQAIREAESPHISLLSLEHLGYQVQEQGQLHHALEIYRQALRILPEGQTTSSLWMAYLGIAEVYREWNKLEEAEQAVLQALKQDRERVAPRVLLEINVVLAVIKHARERTDESLALLRQEEMIGHQKQFAPTINMMRAYQALFEVRRDNTQAALPWMQDFEQQTASYPLSTASEREYRVLACVQLAAGKLAEAEAGLTQLLALAQKEDRMRAVIKIMALQALVLQAQGAMDRAISTIIQALTLAEPEGYVLTFTEEGVGMTRLLNSVLTVRRAGASSQRFSPEYLKLLLDASAPSKTPSNTLLSERELEILRLISSGLSNQEIADRLVIAMTTVKWHVRQIFNKLNVNSRTQVLARARELSLL
jgi:LuxR family maltose regulon positive regulatory protein